MQVDLVFQKAKSSYLEKHGYGKTEIMTLIVPLRCTSTDEEGNLYRSERLSTVFLLHISMLSLLVAVRPSHEALIS